ncbi:MAG TPA: asparagine synthase (glutamine-hydrolyzing) [Opitutaceae bacterium]|nr:asparagine synthase (glutamine-hydrolyzing) [Opitutaceae bacterium]
MCGIAGFVSAQATLEMRTAAVGRMCQSMLHRGPDDAGMESNGDATIGMRRLAIFDPANGHQPMTTPDGRFILVFNGAIYNFRALRNELAAAGHSFRTQCDTEVLLAAYAQWGERCLPRLQGMFAFAVWDAQEKSLFLARDAFGIKPLYFRHENGGPLLFASELNALLASGAFAAEIDPQAVASYLAWFAVPAPRTIYRGVRSLRPGECAVWKRGQLAVRSHWTFGAIPRTQEVCATREAFTAELRARLETTIRAHVIADVPVGAFLSGGLDSAVVVGLMTRIGGARLKTFSITFPEAAFSEAAAAAQTARHFGTEHHPVELTGARLAGDLDSILGHLDQPTGDGINTYYASQAARMGGVTVALSGLGGDELFGGYPSFRDLPRLARWLPWWKRLPRVVRDRLVAQLRRGDTRRRKLADFLQHARDLPELAALQRRVFDGKTRRALLNPDLNLFSSTQARAHHPELDALRLELEEAGEFETISAWELRTYMTDVLLRDSDVMSMRHSLELRVPFIDRPFIEWLWRQPARFKDDQHPPKAALAEAVRDVLPPDLLTRAKRGFSLPFPVWMKRELKPFLDATFAADSINRSGWFNPGPTAAFWRDYVDGSDDRGWSRVWSLAVLIDFVNRRPAVDAKAVAEPRAAVIDLSSRTHPRPPGVGRRRRTLLMAPEIFATEGGIPRILQLYLKALCDLAEPNRAVRLLALNDAVVDSGDLRRYANDRLDDWYVCSKNKDRFVKAALRMSRGCDTIICGHVAQLPVALAARCLNPGLRYYLVAHGIEVWRRFTLAERLALRGAKRIFCVSDFTRRELLRNCPLPEGKAVVLHNALDPHFEIKAGIPPASAAPTILTVTRLTHADRYKGVEHLIEAMPAVLAAIPDARLRIIGRGDDLPRLQALRDKRQLGNAVEFLGFVEDERMTREFTSCRLFALPSQREGFGLVFLEAMAHGRPCLGARAGGIPEVIDDASGVLVEYGDVPDVARGCVAALQRTWDGETILDRARHFSYSHFRANLASLLAP